MCYIGVTEGKIEKEAKLVLASFFFIYTIHLASLKVYISLKTLAPIGTEKSATDISLERILFDLILYVPSTIFQLNRDRSSWVEPVLS